MHHTRPPSPSTGLDRNLEIRSRVREQEKEVGVLLASRDRQTGRVLGREGCNDACLGYKKEKEKEKGCNDAWLGYKKAEHVRGVKVHYMHRRLAADKRRCQ